MGRILFPYDEKRIGIGWSKSFYTIHPCDKIMEMTVLPEVQETLRSWKKKKKHKKKKEQDDEDEHEENDKGHL